MTIMCSMSFLWKKIKNDLKKIYVIAASKWKMSNREFLEKY